MSGAAGLAAFNLSMRSEMSTCHAEATQLHGALDPNNFKPFKLIAKSDLTGNTKLYRFELPENQPSGLTTASCLVTKFVGQDQKPVIRPYTPISLPSTRGHLDLAIKIYPGGAMGTHIDGLKIGDTLEMKGPIPKFPYTPNKFKTLGMVAGGTGIAPMLQIIDEVLNNSADKTIIHLVYGNQSEADIILKDRIDSLVAKHPKQLIVTYVVDKATTSSWMDADGWIRQKHATGFVTKQLLSQSLPPPSNETMVFVCGPPPMMNAVSGPKAPDWSQGETAGLLAELGFTKDNVFKF